MARAASDEVTKAKLGKLYRSARLERAGFDKEKRTVKVRLSTEAPVKQWIPGIGRAEEILDHSPESIDLDFFRAGGAALVEHDTDRRCGIVQDVQIVDRALEVTFRFARNAMGDACMAEVEDDTLRWVSVGYRVMEYQINEDKDKARAVRWQPLEGSFVAIPADQNAKVLRGTIEAENEVTLMFKRSIQLDAQPAGGGGGVAAPTIQPTQADLDKLVSENERKDEIYGTSLHFQRTHPKVAEMAEKALKDKTPLAKYLREVADYVASTQGAADLTQPVIGDGQARSQRNAMSAGHRFVDSEAYKRAIKTNSADARRNICVQFQDEYSFRAVNEMLARATFNATTEGIAGTSGANIQVVPGVPGILLQQPLLIADLFAQGSTGADTIRYIQEDAFTNAATRVAEGAGKPEATLNVSIVNAAVEKTAVFTKVTDEMLADFQQMSSFVNGRLGYMVQALEDSQLLVGTGTAMIRGIVNFTGIQTTSGAAAPIDAVARAIEFVRGANGAGFANPTAVVMHPLDWLNFKLSKDTNGQYLFGGPGYAPYGVGGYSNVSMCWGLPLVSTTSMTRGTAVTGDFRGAAQIFRRQGLTIATTNSNEDDFKNNLIAIRAEQRMALACYQPNRFCTITSIPA